MSGTLMLNGTNYTSSGNLRLGGDVANPNIADVYDPTQTYNTGDRRIYDDVLYVCNDDNVTGAWDSTKWDSATVDEIISALKMQDIDNVTLTTSDNNKLLGVSVVDGDISVGAVGVVSQTLNASDMNIPTGCELYSGAPNAITIFYGKLVILQYSIKITTNGAKQIGNFVPSAYTPSATFAGGGETGLGDGKYQSVKITNTASFTIYPVNNAITYAIGTMLYTL